jgi:hypothetical protein
MLVCDLANSIGKHIVVTLIDTLGCVHACGLEHPCIYNYRVGVSCDSTRKGVSLLTLECIETILMLP